MVSPITIVTIQEFIPVGCVPPAHPLYMLLVAIYQMSTPGEGGPQVNKFEHVSGLGHQISSSRKSPCTGGVVRSGGTLYTGGTRPMLAGSSVTRNIHCEQTDRHTRLSEYVFTPER